MISWLGETLVAVTVLMLLVLALRRPVARLFGAGWAYALWAIPALRLVLPPLPILAPEIALPSAVTFIPTAVGGTAPLPVEAGPGQWLPLMLVMWAGGAVLFLLHQRSAYRAFVQRLDADARPGMPSDHGGIPVLVSGAVDGPLALGLIDRRIVVPDDFDDRYTASERRLALAHELTHHRRGDLWWSFAAMLVLALNWFNPVAWVAFRAFRADQELACDAAVAASASGEERCDYAQALVKSATRPGLIAACAFNSTTQLKRRLRMLRAHKISALRRAGGLVTILAVGLASLALAAPGAPGTAAVPLPPAQRAPVVPVAATVTPPAALAEPLRPKARKAPERRLAARAPVAPAPAPVPAKAPPAEEAPLAPAPEPDRPVEVHEHRMAAQGGIGMRRVFIVRRVGIPPGAAPLRIEELSERLRAERAMLIHIADAKGALERHPLRLITIEKESGK